MKAEELATTTKNNLRLINTDNDLLLMQEVSNFNKALNRPPSKQWIKTNNGVKYVPIRIVENLLRTYFGAYQVKPVGQPQVLGNSIVVTVELQVYHPILKQWLSYMGTGAVPIQLKSGSTPLDFDKIIPTALQRNVPAARAFAISNAAKSLGQVFGSMLNNDTDEVSPLYDIYNEQ